MQIAVIRLSAAPLVSPADTVLFGGAEVRAFLFAQGLAELTEHDVQLVVRGQQRATASCGRLVIRAVSDPQGKTKGAGWCPARVHSLHHLRRLSRSLARRLTGQPSVWPALRDLSADVLCSFGLHDPTASVVRSAQMSGKRSVVFLTSDDETRQATFPAARRDRHRRWRRYALDHADLIVAQTRFQQELVQRRGRPVVLIRNPIDTRSAPDEGIVPMTERKHVLWIGRADRDCKRADLCLQLAAECPAVRFLAVMNPQDRATELQLLASRPPNVEVVPRIQWRQTDGLYRHALALLNTSESEGFPNAFLQAAKFGVPILSRRVNPDHVLTEHGIGFVAHDDLSRLAQMLRQLHATPERFSWVSRAGRRYVERYHALESRVDQLHGALESLRAESRPAEGGERRAECRRKLGA